MPRENVQVFATEAMRTVKNKEDMLGAIRKESGLNVDTLSPPMESLFGAMGARSGFNHVDGLFMDLGGGSVQMTYVNSKVQKDYDVLAAEAANSMWSHHVNIDRAQADTSRHAIWCCKTYTSIEYLISSSYQG